MNVSVFGRRSVSLLHFGKVTKCSGSRTALSLFGRLFSSSSNGILSGVSELIGNTPIVQLNNRMPGLPSSVNVFAKLEFYNPSSSVKDRLGLAVIQHAEATGRLKPGDTVVEATSGNTGIALAMICAERGYRCVLTMTETFSVERRKIMRAYGAKVILTPAADRGTGMVNKAKELAAKFGYFYPKQFENSVNADFHAATTGPEILQAFSRTQLDAFVTGWGTGGTFQGVGRVLRAASPTTKIVLVEPSSAAMVAGGAEKQKRNEDGSPAAEHPAFKPHTIQGWAPNFIPLIVDKGLKLNLADELLSVTDDEAIEASLALARTQGMFVGISAGGSMAGAVKVAQKLAQQAKTDRKPNVLAMLPDTGERYLSTPLFKNIAAEMNEEETSISKSTPSNQLKSS